MWKPGQLVTIEGKVYRVKKTIGPPCEHCDILYMSKTCFRVHIFGSILTSGNFLKQVYPKT